MNTIEEHELAIAIILSMYDDIVDARWWARRLKRDHDDMKLLLNDAPGYILQLHDEIAKLKTEARRLKAENARLKQSCGELVQEIEKLTINSKPRTPR